MNNLRLSFCKSDMAIYLSHLDIMRTFQRAFFRAGIPLKHTEGFNPRPCMTILQPLALGYSGKKELMDISLEDQYEGDLIKDVNEKLPDGILLTGSWAAEKKTKEIKYASYTIEISFNQEISAVLKNKLDDLFKQPTIEVIKKTKSGEKLSDIKPLIQSVALKYDNNICVLDCVLACGEPMLNPVYLVNAIKNYTDIKDLKTNCTREKFYTAEMTEFK